MDKRRSDKIFLTIASVLSVLTGVGLVVHIVLMTMAALQGKIDLFNFNDIGFLRAIGFGAAWAGILAFFVGYTCIIIKGRSEHLTSDKKFGLREKLFWTLCWVAMMAIGGLGMKMGNLGMRFFVGWVIMISVSVVWIVYELAKQ